ncbi:MULTISPECIES: TraR/DksA C4-type zinc finger protein [Paenibacillus]|uniref:Molecular chaperone DnaK n=1 Tax=Paenibacillus phytohabitans TaxID=2654978 RepID=A0ABX1YNK7_9BACL|nr:MULTISPECIES: TraR/DksA C4-type zinc finger protein [Paenibacillus]AIQ42958.1 molecular chaperone DnaK [Paenibacillus sp. FSL R5-0912]NOU82645.1 molecular chaperone DnaK [Paenibacillus phytohabitans]OMF28346.1 molecular chaperone DnaK [Paenibacillus sp. FSL H8-0259]
MSHLTSTQLSGLRALLLQQQEDIKHRLQNNEHYGLQEAMRDTTGELSEIDNHPGDAATELYNRSMDISLLERDEHELDDIEAALRAMDEGTYGICIASGEPIPYERLAAIPSTRYTKEHAPRQSAPFTRPVEEELLSPPFGRTSLDEREDQNGFDGEDAWQIVESWGNSDSPAMAEGNNISSYNDMEIEADETEGFVEPWENFVATDITGNHLTIIKGNSYRHYMDDGEGDYLLDPLKKERE